MRSQHPEGRRNCPIRPAAIMRMLAVVGLLGSEVSGGREPSETSTGHGRIDLLSGAEEVTRMITTIGTAYTSTARYDAFCVLRLNLDSHLDLQTDGDGQITRTPLAGGATEPVLIADHLHECELMELLQHVCLDSDCEMCGQMEFRNLDEIYYR